jgi:hypothetical protein
MKGTQEDGQGSAAMEVWVGPATTHGRALGHAPTSASRRQWWRSRLRLGFKRNVAGPDGGEAERCEKSDGR